MCLKLSRSFSAISISKYAFSYCLSEYASTVLYNRFDTIISGFSPDWHLCSALNHVKKVLEQVDLHVLQSSVDTTMP